MMERFRYVPRVNGCQKYEFSSKEGSTSTGSGESFQPYADTNKKVLALIQRRCTWLRRYTFTVLWCEKKFTFKQSVASSCFQSLESAVTLPDSGRKFCEKLGSTMFFGHS